MKRRTFGKLSVGAASLLLLDPTIGGSFVSQTQYIRLGGPLFGQSNNPEEWINKVKSSGYRAAYCPLKPGADEQLIKEYRAIAEKNDIVIAEVGAWSNLISPNDQERKAAIEKCILSLDLANKIGANCCVNVSGSRNPKYWAGPHEDNLKKDTFDIVVDTTRQVIDAVQPTNTYFALEPMPWSFPDSPESYLDLIKAINRKRFGVHMDPVNMVSSPQLYFNNGEFIKSCFKKLGPHIRSCHGKDIILREDNYIPQLDELRPGLGKLNYQVFLTELAKLKDIPLMMEHLKTAEEYDLAAEHIRSVGKELGIVI